MRPQIGLYALIVLLNCFYTSVFVKSQGADNIDEYYLDSLGHICTDTVDTVQKVEYDSQIHCTVSPMLVCDEDEEVCLLYTSPSPRDVEESRMPSSA